MELVFAIQCVVMLLMLVGLPEVALPLALVCIPLIFWACRDEDY